GGGQGVAAEVDDVWQDLDRRVSDYGGDGNRLRRNETYCRTNGRRNLHFLHSRAAGLPGHLRSLEMEYGGKEAAGSPDRVSQQTYSGTEAHSSNTRRGCDRGLTRNSHT